MVVLQPYVIVVRGRTQHHTQYCSALHMCTAHVSAPYMYSYVYVYPVPQDWVAGNLRRVSKLYYRRA